MPSDKTGAAEHGQATLEGLFFGDTETLYRPLRRIPNETWTPGQATPLCSSCDDNYDRCHYCRGIHMARPFTWGR